MKKKLFIMSLAALLALSLAACGRGQTLISYLM
jgi:predicted small lipoprotein YifL